MALRGTAKTDYQREYMRMRRGSNAFVRPPVRPPVRPIDNLRQVIKSIENKDKAHQCPPGEVSLPLYDPAIHRPGDKVMVKPVYGKKLMPVVLPELDAGGQPIPNYD